MLHNKLTRRSSVMKSILANFTTYVPEKLRGQIFVSATKYGLLFSSATVKILKQPATVSVYFNEVTKQMAIKADGEIKFFSGKSKYVRSTSKRLKRVFEAIAGEASKKFPGKYFEDEQVVIFDLK